MREYDPTVIPAEAWEVAEWVTESVLKLDATLEGLLLGTGRIYAHRFTGPPPAQGEWGRVLFREPMIPAQRSASNLQIYQQPYDLLIEVANSDDPAWNPDRAAADIYSRCYALIVGTKPTLQRGDSLIGFRGSGPPSSLMEDLIDHSFFKNATFRLVLQPL